MRVLTSEINYESSQTSIHPASDRRWLIEVISLSVSERHPVISEKVLSRNKVAGRNGSEEVLEQIRLKEEFEKFYGSSFESEILLTDC